MVVLHGLPSYRRSFRQKQKSCILQCVFEVTLQYSDIMRSLSKQYTEHMSVVVVRRKRNRVWRDVTRHNIDVTQVWVAGLRVTLLVLSDSALVTCVQNTNNHTLVVTKGIKGTFTRFCFKFVACLGTSRGSFKLVFTVTVVISSVILNSVTREK